MGIDTWTQLVKRVDMLINELRVSRAETKKWRERAVELERLKGGSDRTMVLQSQAKERELERYRRERAKIITSINKMISDLEQVQIKAMEKQDE
jgi:hypothetical protein